MNPRLIIRSHFRGIVIEMKPWSDLSLAEKVAAVREMAGRKLSLSQMAVELGTTKGAVSGIHRRSGFAHKSKVTITKTMDGFPDAVPLLAARPHHCRWVLTAENDMPAMVCGAHALDPDHPWCEQHMKRVFIPHRSSKTDYRTSWS
jgi:hypothetical protein